MPKKSVDIENKSVAFAFEEGEAITVDLASLPAEMVTNLALHGLSQKCGDSYAGAKKAIEGTEQTAEEYARVQVAGVIAQLVAGDWNVRSGGSGPSVTDLARALSEATGEALDTCVEVLAEKSKEEKAALRKHPGIKVILQRIRAEKAAAAAAKAEAEAAEAPAQDLTGLFG